MPIEFQIATIIYKIFTVCFLLTGTVTNALSALVYSKKRMRKTSYAIYLFSLAIVDFLVTINGNLRLLMMSYEMPWLSNALNYEITRQHEPESIRQVFSGVDIRLTSLFACKLHRFFTYLLMQLSSVILSALSIDRFFGCVLVLKSSQFCKPVIATRVVIVSVVVLFVLNIHFLVFMGYELEHELPDAINQTILVVRCLPNPERPTYMSIWRVYFYLDSAFYCFLPFLIMFFCNLSIIAKIVKSRVSVLLIASFNYLVSFFYEF